MSQKKVTITESVVLSNPGQWNLWLAMIRRSATSGDIWEYIDPNVTQHPALISRPTHPKPSDVQAEAARISDLTATDKTDYTLLQKEFLIAKADYRTQKKSLTDLLSLISSTVDQKYQLYLNDTADVREILRILKANIALSEFSRRNELSASFAKVSKVSKNASWEKWLDNWERVYYECRVAGLAVASEDEAMRVLITAVQQISPACAGGMHSRIRERRERGEPLLVQSCTEEFREFMRLVKPSSSTCRAAYPASYQGKDKDGKSRSKSRSNRKDELDCPCGNSHYHHKIRTCYYIVKERRPDSWKPRDDIEKRVARALKDDSSLREFVAQVRKEANTSATASISSSKAVKPSAQSSSRQRSSSSSSNSSSSIPPVAFPINTRSAFSSTVFELRDSVIFDCSASYHVMNDKNRFITELRPVSDTLLAGDSSLEILGVGDASITVCRSDGTNHQLILTDALYVPSLHTSCASSRLFINRRTYWDQLRHVLYHEPTGQEVAQLAELHGQYVLDYQPLTSSITSSSSFAMQKVESILSAETWHLRLGHPGATAVQHLSESIKISKADAIKIVECEGCSLSKAKAVISREPSSRASSPFYRLHIDLFKFEKGKDGLRYATLIADDYSSVIFVYPVDRKSQLFDTILGFQSFVKRQFFRDISVIHTDGEKAINTAGFRQWAADEGIKLEISSPHTPAQNGRAERSGGGNIGQISSYEAISAISLFSVVRDRTGSSIPVQSHATARQVFK